MTESTRAAATPPDHRLPPARGPAATPVLAGNGRRGHPDDLRREIEETRARMTRTLDEIEGRLVQRKEELVAKATLRDVRRKLSRDPWRAMAIALVAGYVVAALRD